MKRRSTYHFPFEQYPAVRLALLFSFGIIISHQFETPFLYSLIATSLVIFSIILSEWILQARVSLVLSRLSSILYILAILGVGTSLHGLRSIGGNTLSEQILYSSPWEEIKIEGEVYRLSESNSGAYRADVSVYSIELADGLQLDDRFKTRMLLDEEGGYLQLGYRVSALAKVVPIQERRNPGAFDYKKYLASQEIYTQVKVDSVYKIQKHINTWSWTWLRLQALKQLDTLLTSSVAPIAKALLLGHKSSIEQPTREAFSRAGLSHIMAVSGLHVGLVITPFWIIMPWLWSFKNGKKIGFLLLGALLIFYAGLTGFSTPVIRASAMALFLTYGKLFSKNADSINLTAFAAIVILIWKPSQLFEIGFQLSFSAVFIILLVLPVVQNTLPYWVRLKWFGAPLMAVILSVIVQLGLYPLQAYYFGEISLISPIANALFVPLLALVVPLALLALLVSIIWLPLSELLILPVNYFLEWMQAFVQYSTTYQWSWHTVDKPSLWIFLLWISAVALVASWRQSAIKWKYLRVFLALIGVFLILQIHEKRSTPILEVVFLDVGQGDAAVVHTPDQKTFLIDAGVWSPSGNSAQYVILPYLKFKGVERIHGVFLSHPHADHIGGIVELMNSIPIDTLYHSGYRYDSELYQRYLTLAEQMKLPIRQLQSGDFLNLDASTKAMVLGPQNLVGDDPNEHSLILNLIYGENEFLFVGDAGEHQERRLLTNYASLLDIDVLKVGHHGSNTSSTIEFIQQLTPEIAIVSVAEQNRFRHPHAEAVQRLKAFVPEIYYTSRDRALIFQSNGKHLKRVHWY